MEVERNWIEVAIMRGVVAGKLRRRAEKHDGKTADALRRAADRYSAGVSQALDRMNQAGIAASIAHRQAEGLGGSCA